MLVRVNSTDRLAQMGLYVDGVSQTLRTKLRGDVATRLNENVILFPSLEERGSNEGPIRCRERLGGLLKYYYREAA